MPATANNPHSTIGLDPTRNLLLLVGLAVLGFVGGLSWVTAKVASTLFDNGDFDAGMQTSIVAFSRLKGHMGNPAAAWPPEVQSTLPGPFFYWLTAVLVLAAFVAVGVLGWRLFRGEPRDLDRRRRLGVPRSPGWRCAATSATSYVRTLPGDRFFLGRHGRRLVAAEATRPGRGRQPGRNARGPVALLGPSRSGKSTQAVAGILGWTGPAILVSVKADLLHDTERASARARRGQDLRPHRSDRPKVVLVEPAPFRRDTQRGDEGREADGGNRAPQLGRRREPVRLLAHPSRNPPRRAAAAGGEHRQDHGRRRRMGHHPRPAHRRRRRRSHAAAAGIAEIRVHQARAAGQAAFRLLKGVWKADPRTSSSVYASAKSIVWPWNDPIVAAASTKCDVDWAWLTSGNNTLYVCAPLTDQGRLAPVLSGLLVDLTEQAFDRYVATNEPFKPAVLFVIDEAANCRLDAMPQWAATLSGLDIQLVTVWQSRAQIEAVYGRQADAILTNHLSKLFFPGMSDQSGLDYVGAPHRPRTRPQPPRRKRAPRPLGPQPRHQRPLPPRQRPTPNAPRPSPPRPRPPPSRTAQGAPPGTSLDREERMKIAPRQSVST